MTDVFETADELQGALAKVFNTLQQAGENRPALRAVEEIADLNRQAAEYGHLGEPTRQGYNRRIKEAYAELEEALQHCPFLK